MRILIRTQLAIALLCLICPVTAQAELGLQFTGIGAVNRSMGGAATAAPIDSIGAIHWNPATISGLPGSELSTSLEGVFPRLTTTSAVPAAGLAGSSDSDTGWVPVPSIGLVIKDRNSPVTYGLGIYGIGGVATNYPASTTNPYFFPQTPTGVTPAPGFGKVTSEATLLQIAPVASLQVTDRLSIGAGPTINLARVHLNPFALAPSNDANGDGVFTWPDGTGTRFHWGGGFEVGAYYEGANGINLGASYKSRQWFEDMSYNSADELGLPISIQEPFELPQIVSLGLGYTGIEHMVLAMDVRYVDWQNATPFGNSAAFSSPPFGTSSRALGLGWKSIWSIGVGAQYQMTDAVALRLGYSANENPIPASATAFNVFAPLPIMHSISTGATIALNRCLDLNLSYYHAFDNPITGPLPGPPGSNVSISVKAHIVTIGLTAKF